MNTTIKNTRNYELFTENHEQRPVSKTHVNSIINSMRCHGFVQSKPLQVYKDGGQYVIVDGHHRYYAAKSLGLPIYYVIEQESAQETIADINSKVKSWKADDYVRMYASRGLSDYIELMAYKESGINITTAASFLYNNISYTKVVSSDIVNGTFEIKDRWMADTIVNLINEYGERFPLLKKQAFAKAFGSCLRIKGFELNKFTEALEKRGATMENAGTAKQMIQQIDDIYNYGKVYRLPITHLVWEMANNKSGKKTAALK